MPVGDIIAGQDISCPHHHHHPHPPKPPFPPMPQPAWFVPPPMPLPIPVDYPHFDPYHPCPQPDDDDKDKRKQSSRNDCHKLLEYLKDLAVLLLFLFFGIFMHFHICSFKMAGSVKIFRIHFVRIAVSDGKAPFKDLVSIYKYTLYIIARLSGNVKTF